MFCQLVRFINIITYHVSFWRNQFRHFVTSKQLMAILCFGPTFLVKQLNGIKNTKEKEVDKISDTSLLQVKSYTRTAKHRYLIMIEGQPIIEY